jgi:pyridinium-3,5-bisthiocarboxylic acid mononucleotide nickel chelatase
MVTQKIAYLECPTGIAGDMCLGALVSAGVPLEYLSQQLSQLGISTEYQLSAELVQRNGQQATKVHVTLTDANAATPTPIAEPGIDPFPTFQHRHSHQHPHQHAHIHADEQPGGQRVEMHQDTHSHDHTHTRHLPEIEQLIKQANLPERAEAWSLAVFRRLAEAEGAVHGIPPEAVHFHEVGATDAIVDIVGTCLGLDWLAIDHLYCSALPTGGGTVWAAHGRLPVPTPAVLKLWEMRQVPIYSNGIERELVTPTGAAIVTTLAQAFGTPPTMTLQQVGLGAGSRDLPIPNILRLWIGERYDESTKRAVTSAPLAKQIPSHSSPLPHPSASSLILPPSQEPIAVLETQIDDLSPQAIGYVFDALFAVGAVDVFTQAIGMKKSRPGVLLTVVCHPEQVEACEAVLFRETTTLGIRRSLQQRTILKREMQTVETEYGTVRIKVAWAEDSRQPANVQPEYEDCAQIARQQQLPWREVHRMALELWHAEHQT